MTFYELPHWAKFWLDEPILSFDGDRQYRTSVWSLIEKSWDFHAVEETIELDYQAGAARWRKEGYRPHQTHPKLAPQYALAVLRGPKHEFILAEAESLDNPAGWTAEGTPLPLPLWVHREIRAIPPASASG